MLAGAGLLVGLIAGGGTFALWNADASVDGGTITSGNLDIEWVGTAAEWRETSADVTSPQDPITNPGDFLVRQGDTVTVTRDFTTDLQGDNMLGKLSVDWSQESSSVPAGVIGDYTIYDAASQPLVTGDLGVPPGPDGVLDQLDADDAGRTDTYTLEITLDFTGMDDRFRGGTEQTADLGTFQFTLDQVR